MKINVMKQNVRGCVCVYDYTCAAYPLASWDLGSSSGQQWAVQLRHTHPSSGPPAEGRRVAVGQRHALDDTAPNHQGERIMLKHAGKNAPLVNNYTKVCCIEKNIAKDTGHKYKSLLWWDSCLL